MWTHTLQLMFRNSMADVTRLASRKAPRMSERSLLVQRLSDQADICIEDGVRLAQLAIVVDRQVVHQAPAALQAFQERAVTTEEVLRRTAAALSELEQSLSAAAQSAQGVQEVYKAVCGDASTAGCASLNSLPLRRALTSSRRSRSPHRR